MCVRDIEFTYLYDFSIECWNCSTVCYIFFHFIIGYEKTPAELQLLKKNMVVIVFVIKIVKMKYNRIKW